MTPNYWTIQHHIDSLEVLEQHLTPEPESAWEILLSKAMAAHLNAGDANLVQQAGEPNLDQQALLRLNDAKQKIQEAITLLKQYQIIQTVAQL